MKKVVFSIFIIAAIYSNATAQKVYIQGGANFANITKDKNGNKDSHKSLVSFNAGIIGSFGLSNILDTTKEIKFEQIYKYATKHRYHRSR